MNVTFLLPGSGRTPVGGYKVVYEYANRLTLRGHRVCVVHAALAARDAAVAQRLNRMRRYLQQRVTHGYRPDAWFALHPDVRVSWIPDLRERRVPDADVVVATAWQTAEWAAGYGPRKGRKVYLIQGWEVLGGREERLRATWRLPLRKVFIAHWLEHIAHAMGETGTVIPNGLDFQAFGLDVAPEDRDPHQVLMLHHRSASKGAGDGLAALKLVREQVPRLRATLFGLPQPPAQLPSWITYVRNPRQGELRRLYNAAATFLAPSHSEGWGLTASEAMLCGAAVAATDIGGHREFAEDGVTASLCPPQDAVLLAQNLQRLVQDRELRVRLARAGHAAIQRFTWDGSVARFEQVLAEVAG